MAPQALTEGQRVWLRTLGKPVEIRERLRGGEQLRVAIGGVALVVDAKDVGALAGGPVEPKRSSTRRGVSPPPRPGHPPKPKRVGVGLDNLPPGGIDGVDDDDPISPTPRSAQNSVDVRGLRRDDIAGEVEPLLDRAYAEDRRVVWIIHGHGTGALRDEVRQTIKGSPYVSHWRPGRRHEGGDGVTLAWLRVD